VGPVLFRPPADVDLVPRLAEANLRAHLLRQCLALALELIVDVDEHGRVEAARYWELRDALGEYLAYEWVGESGPC
jgi:hypothetical protein